MSDSEGRSERLGRFLKKTWTQRLVTTIPLVLYPVAAFWLEPRWGREISGGKVFGFGLIAVCWISGMMIRNPLKFPVTRTGESKLDEEQKGLHLRALSYSYFSLYLLVNAFFFYILLSRVTSTRLAFIFLGFWLYGLVLPSFFWAWNLRPWPID